MSAETLELDIRARRGDFQLDVCEQIPLEGITAVFGPSGGGKTSLLRQIAGFERPDEGRITLGNEIWFDSKSGLFQPPHRRPVGLMFQDARLFSHMTLAANLEYAVKRSSGPINAEAVIAALDLASLLERRPATLSGGETQRAALARTLLTQPRLLMLDEPISALDIDRKSEILPYLATSLRSFNVPALYVSHSIDEVAQLADRVLLIEGGQKQAFGPATAVLDRYDLEAMTGRFGAGAVIDGQVLSHDERLCLSEIAIGTQALALPIAAHLPIGAPVRLRIRSRDVSIATESPAGVSIRNVLPVTISELHADPASAYAELCLNLNDVRLRARVTRAAVEALNLEPGQEVFALIKTVSFETRLN
jgi:molybdate transport system ATP-binding protein